MVERTFAVVFLSLLTCIAWTAEIYVYEDVNGRPVFGDIPVYLDHATIEPEPLNSIDFAEITSPQATPSKKRRDRKRGVGSPKALSMDELRGKCSTAANNYARFRTRGSNEDWPTYKAALARRANQRDYWCGRLLKRK